MPPYGCCCIGAIGAVVGGVGGLNPCPGVNAFAPTLNLNSFAVGLRVDLIGLPSSLAVMGGGAVPDLEPVALATSAPVRSTPL